MFVKTVQTTSKKIQGLLLISSLFILFVIVQFVPTFHVVAVVYKGVIRQFITLEVLTFEQVNMSYLVIVCAMLCDEPCKYIASKGFMLNIQYGGLALDQVYLKHFFLSIMFKKLAVKSQCLNMLHCTLLQQKIIFLQNYNTISKQEHKCYFHLISIKDLHSKLYPLVATFFMNMQLYSSNSL